jgi:hypothetical protein
MPSQHGYKIQIRIMECRSSCRAGSQMTDSRELASYKLDLVGMQEVRWERGGPEPAGEKQILLRKAE